MARTVGRSALVLALALVLGGTVLAAPASADTVSTPLRTAVANLPVATEVRTGYSRDLFPHWIDADGDGCNTRNEVLIAEAVSAPSVGPVVRCLVAAGTPTTTTPTGRFPLTSTPDNTSYLWRPPASQPESPGRHVIGMPLTA
jgi:hypothetical protein